MPGTQRPLKRLLLWSQKEATMSWTKILIIDMGNRFIR